MTTDVPQFRKERALLGAGTIEYAVAGQGEPLVYLHSAGGVRYTRPLHSLAKSHRVYIPVLPGFDGSQAVDEVDSVPKLAGLISDFVAHITDDPVDVIGHSFGGWVALWLAVLAPDRVGQLVLECPAGLNVGGGDASNGDPEDIRRRMYAHPELLHDEEKAAEMVRNNRYAARSYRGGLDIDAELLARLGEIEAFTLVLQGTMDGIVPEATAQLLKSRLKRVYMMYVHDAAHNIEVDQPDRFSRLVGQFLRQGEAFIINFGDEPVRP